MTSDSLGLDFKPDFQPLAARLRARSLDEYVGQQHLLAQGKPLRTAIEQGHLHSMILWGPPGTGKTTLAELIARHANASVSRLSAVTSGVKDIRLAIDEAKQRAQQQGRRTLLFVDEVHRFNKSQQDAFLPHIEDGTVVFIGATTENPGFELNNALLSRARVYRLQSLT
ncbi:MAG TPA: recombination factor protein RarA, partial [Idiomarina sp.]|nr:recombination factor protein RarA [Idiomarina sp.]